MKMLLTTIATLLVVLCATTTVFAETPAPTPSPLDMPQLAVPNAEQSYYSDGATSMVKPKFVVSAKSKSILDGADTSFFVEFIGYPLPTIYVYFNGRPLDMKKKAPSGFYKYTLSCDKGKCLLIIWEAELEDGGEYSFVAKNTVGTAKTSAMLTVKEITKE